MLARSVAMACFRCSKLIKRIQDVLIGTMHQAPEAHNRPSRGIVRENMAYTGHLFNILFVRKCLQINMCLLHSVYMCRKQEC